MELWSAKYRPTILNDVIILPEYRKKLSNYIKTGNLNHCVFSGRPGTGKTTTAMVLKNHFIHDESDCLFLNASNDRGIDAIRNNVLDFMKIPPFASRIKLVIMDEADNLTPDAWKVLRSPIENEDDNPGLATRFIFTANIDSKIPDFIKSRCDCYAFTTPSKGSIFDRCEYILVSEKITYSKDDVMAAMIELYPDVRATINYLQKNSIDGKFTYTANVDVVKEITKMAVDIFSKYENVKASSEILFKLRNLNMDIDYLSIARSILKEDIPLEVTPVLNHYINSFSIAVDQKSHFIAMLCDSILILRKFNNVTN